MDEEDAVVITLDLTEQDAQHLADLLAAVGGNDDHRRTADIIRLKLLDDGVDYSNWEPLTYMITAVI